MTEGVAMGVLPAELIPHKPPDRDVFLEQCRHPSTQIVDRARLFLALIADERLVEQRDLLEMLGELDLDGLLAELLVHVLGLGKVNRALTLLVLLGHIVR